MQGTQARIRKYFLLLVTILIHGVISETAGAQSRPTPQLFIVSPSGGQAGSSFEVTVTGQNLQDAEGLYFNVPGVKAVSLGAGSTVPPPANTKKKPQLKMTGPQNKLKFKVTLPANARAGIHDIRVITKGGISNPRAFVIGDLQEFVETEPNDDVPQAQRVPLNSAVSGVIANPTDVDYFVFAGTKGQRVVASCLTTSIDSRLPASIELYTSTGSYLGSGRGYHENDALLDQVLPEDGDYYVRVASFSYTVGGPEYFYRLTISTAPWIDAVFPSVVEPGTTATLTVYGRNLPEGKLDPAIKVAGKTLEKMTLKVKVPDDPLALQRLDYRGWIAPNASALDGFEIRVRNEAGVSNPALVTYADAPVVLDNENNDTPETAQQVTLPCEIAGRIEKKADRDWYAFQAKKGDIYSIELFGDRLGSPLDLFFTLQDATGRIITEQEDTTEVLSPQFFSRSYDPPRYRFVVPADGDYQLLVGSRESFVQAGPRHRYQVRIAPERPDFRLVVMPPGTQRPPPAAIFPDAPVVGQGGNQALPVLVWRKDGFNADIVLTAKDLPPGVTIAPQVLPAGQKQTFLVVSASAGAAAWTGPITIMGTATVKGRKLVREARAATITWPVPQINIPAISRLDRSVVLAVRDPAAFSLVATVDKFTALPGGKIVVPVKLTRNLPSMKGPVQITALNLPAGLTFNNITLAPGKDTTNVTLNVKTNAQPGTFTAVFRGQTQLAGGKQLRGRLPLNLAFQPSTPITVTILPKQLAKLSVTTTVKVAAGKETVVAVKVSRMYDFDGPFKVQVVPPADTKGIQVREVEIATGKNEANLVIRADGDAPLGNRANVIVRATAMFHGTAIVHETKINVAVVR